MKKLLTLGLLFATGCAHIVETNTKIHTVSVQTMGLGNVLDAEETARRYCGGPVRLFSANVNVDPPIFTFKCL